MALGIIGVIIIGIAIGFIAGVFATAKTIGLKIRHKRVKISRTRRRRRNG
jgi:F0F1-type ATP synthase assembly protein I